MQLIRNEPNSKQTQLEMSPIGNELCGRSLAASGPVRRALSSTSFGKGHLGSTLRGSLQFLVFLTGGTFRYSHQICAPVFSVCCLKQGVCNSFRAAKLARRPGPQHDFPSRAPERLGLCPIEGNPFTIEGNPLLWKEVPYYRRKSLTIEGNPLL